MSDFRRGLQNFQRDLHRKVDKLQQLSQPRDVSFTELFNPAFMRRHTKVASIEALFEAGGYDIKGPDDFKAIPDLEWEAHIRSHTHFQSWQEMQRVATEERNKDQLR